MSRAVASFCAVVAMSTLGVGCYASAGAGPAPAYQTTADDGIAYEAAPPSIETYPSVVYEGQPHYYVNGRWYVHTAKGWGYRRQEPPQLAQHRPAPRAEPQRGEPRKEEPRKEEPRKEEERKDEHR